MAAVLTGIHMTFKANYQRSYNAKTTLYNLGVQLAQVFCRVNSLPVPLFVTYEELMNFDGWKTSAARFARKIMPNANLVGANTGLYKDGTVFVNVRVTAFPVSIPGNRRWSYPGWKTDRTAAGVVAHELGHHVEAMLFKGRRITNATGAAW